MTIESFFYPHRVRVRDVVSTGSRGTTYKPAPGRTLAAEVLDTQQLVLTADGSERLSSTRVTVALAGNVNVGALVTVWPGKSYSREAVVLTVERAENASPLPSYLVLSLE